MSLRSAARLLFIGGVILMALGCEPRTVPESVQHDSDQVNELRDQIDNGEWE